MKLETNNLITETLNFIATKPFQYDQQYYCFQLTESVETGTLRKKGNNYYFKSIELKPQMPKNMWAHYSKKNESSVSEEQAKKIANRRQSLEKIRKRYGLTKSFERQVVACGSYVNGNNEVYVYLLESLLVVLHVDFSGKAAKTYCYDSHLAELSNYATKQNIVLNKRKENRGGARDYYREESEQ